MTLGARFFRRSRYIPIDDNANFRIDVVKKMPANTKGAFVLFEKVHDVYRNYNCVNHITFESMRNMTTSTKVPRAFDLDQGVAILADDERFQLVLEIASKTLADDSSDRKYAVSLGNLITNQEITGQLKSTRVVIRVFVQMKKEIPVRTQVRFRFKYKIRSKVDPEHGKKSVAAAEGAS